jgi:diketogulonate reductase-like aldo/keto reductase
MEEAVRRGLCKNIGVSNFNSKQLKEIMDMCTVPIANVQVCSCCAMPRPRLLPGLVAVTHGAAGLVWP